jgi:hypothetical protein
MEEGEGETEEIKEKKKEAEQKQERPNGWEIGYQRFTINAKSLGYGDQRERWVGSGLLVAEKQFRRIRGYKQLPALFRVLETLSHLPRRLLSISERRREVGYQRAATFNGKAGVPRLAVWELRWHRSGTGHTQLLKS